MHLKCHVPGTYHTKKKKINIIDIFIQYMILSNIVTDNFARHDDYWQLVSIENAGKVICSVC